ncbi:MAG: hypothetical protein JNK67_01405 [Alphaproteobacteria bacterium]|nr:hypothetical protein [Alphaproteobacteria bacterium]
MVPSLDTAGRTPVDVAAPRPTSLGRLERGVGALAMLVALCALMLASFGDDKGGLRAPASVPEAKAAVVAAPMSPVTMSPVTMSPVTMPPVTMSSIPMTSVTLLSASAGMEAAPVSRPLTTLVGLSAAEVVEAIGPAAFVRNEGRSKLLRFVDARCVLFVFVYQAQDLDRVEHVESRASDDGAAPSTAECLASLQRARAPLAQAR